MDYPRRRLMPDKLSPEELAAEIGKHVQLRKAGENSWFGVSPFNAEKTASFHVYRARDGSGRWHDFSSGKDGDSIDWQRLVSGRSWREITGGDYVRALADPAREREQARKDAWNELRDRQPDLPDEARHFLEPDSLRNRLLRVIQEKTTEYAGDRPVKLEIEQAPRQGRGMKL
jgi:hypothetical protein